MEMSCVKAVFFSPTGNTKEIVIKMAKHIAGILGVPAEEYDCTFPGNREKVLNFSKNQLVIVGIPVYAGRIPNKILPFVQSNLRGNEAPAIPVVTFGNRSYDYALEELCRELGRSGFHPVSGAAFVSEHAFSNKIASGRPDREDVLMIEQFAQDAADRIRQLREIPPLCPAAEQAEMKYYTPLGLDKKPAVFLKAKPKTRETCDQCGICAGVCPMGSIDVRHPELVTGICIKCQACIKACPKQAKYFDDPAFLSHVAMLEQNYTGRKENEVFLSLEKEREV